MRHLLIAGVMVLASTANSAAQAQLASISTAPINLTFANATTVDDALTTIARMAGVTIELDTSVTEEMRRAPLAQQPLRLTNITLESAIAALTSMNGLTYTIIGPKAVRVSKKA